jgi:hypothetical protein
VPSAERWKQRRVIFVLDSLGRPECKNIDDLGVLEEGWPPKYEKEDKEMSCPSRILQSLLEGPWFLRGR